MNQKEGISIKKKEVNRMRNFNKQYKEKQKKLQKLKDDVRGIDYLKGAEELERKNSIEKEIDVHISDLEDYEEDHAPW